MYRHLVIGILSYVHRMVMVGWLGLAISLLVVGCSGDISVTIPGCENCPERCLSQDGRRGNCVACLKDEHCQSDSSPTKKCTSDNKCICGSERDCPANTYCIGNKGCVECIKDEHCTNPELSLCTPDNQCAQCRANDQRTCIPQGMEVCAPGIQKCHTNRMIWEECQGWVICKPNERCADQKCVAACPPPCNEKMLQCASTPTDLPGTYRTCVRNDDNCLVWSQDLTTCPKKHEVCHNGQCVPYPCPPATCQIGQTRCIDAKKFTLCDLDHRGCSDWQLPQTCLSDTLCRFALGRCTSCEPGHQRPCYSGPPETRSVGICKDGLQTCDAEGNQYGPCQGEVLPATQEICNGKDDNCNGKDDLADGCDCINGDRRNCYSGTKGCTVSGPGYNCLGACRAGSQTCTDGKWGACEGEILPAEREICGNGIDDNCNGQIDEGCVCTPGHKQVCGSKVGICKQGEQLCDNLGQWGPCTGEVKPLAKELCNGLDDNCNGEIDEDFKKPPNALTTPCTVGLGECLRTGVWQCTTDKTGVECSVKPGTPSKELCDGKDNNCNGQIDEDFKQPPNALNMPCTVGLGECLRTGVWRCTADKTDVECSVKPGEPAKEICDGKDNNCSGLIDEDLTLSCYEGPLDTRDVGECKSGKSYCTDGKYTACLHQVLPQPEICNNQKDDDCDGFVDEQSGRSLTFAGTPDSIRVQHQQDFNFGGSFTIEMWLFFESMGSRNIALLINKHKANVNDGYHLKIETTPQKTTPYFAFSWWHNNIGNQIHLADYPFNKYGKWVHIAFVYNHSQNKYQFYIDGKNETEGTRTINISGNTEPLYFATETTPLGDPYFRGKIAASRISKAAIYQQDFEVTCVFKADTNTIAVWNMEDGGGNIVRDSSTNQYHGTINGAKWNTGRPCNESKVGGCIEP